MRTCAFWVLMCAVLMVATASRSDVAIQPSLSSNPTAEPITGTAVMPAPGSESPPRDPFTPYDPGPKVWPYASLTPAEKAVADRGRDVTGWAEVNNGFATAARERATQAAADAAASQLGVSDLSTIGVVP